MNKEDFHIYRRRLPHWRLKGATYFVTWRIKPGSTVLVPNERSEVCNALKHFDQSRYDLFAYVIMDDHVHVIVRPFENWALENLVHSWKSFTANRLQRLNFRKGQVWQDEYFDRIIRDEDEFLEKAQYIFNNPWKHWHDINEYVWMYFNFDLLAK